MTAGATYAEAWPIYRRAGWEGTLPLPGRAKWPPPTGWTGWDGPYPSGADCTEWSELPTYAGSHQLALRMPSTVVGLDVDAYDGRTGAQTMVEAVRRWGALPAAPWSSARDEVSGIRFYAVPDGTVLVGKLGFPDLELGHVEVIQRHHRYAVAWPSVHPKTGTTYTWRKTAGPDQPPVVAELPRLPVRWCEALAGTGRETERARPEQVDRFLGVQPAGQACPCVESALKEAVSRLVTPRASRHDDTCAAVLRLLRLGEQRHPGVPAALAQLRSRFIAAVTADESRTGAAAAGEYDRMAEGQHGIGLILATPTPEDRRGCHTRPQVGPPTRSQLVGMLRAVLKASPADQARMFTWAARRLRGYAAAGQLDPVYVRNVIGQLRDQVRAERTTP